MLIRKIMKTIGLLLLIGIGVALVVLTVKYWSVMKWVIIMAGSVNLLIWGVVAAIYGEVEGTLWNKINLTLYTAGLYWIIYGLYKLWDNAEEIEYEIRKAKTRRAEKLTLRNDGKNGALSFPGGSGGELSIRDKR